MPIVPLLTRLLVAAAVATSAPEAPPAPRAAFSDGTPPPARFVVRGTELVDRTREAPVFFRGMGYSPYLPGETPLQGAAPADDGRYAAHLALVEGLGVDYLHVFPQHMPAGFFAALDRTALVYGQDVWVWAYADDLLDERVQADALAHIRSVIDHAYRVGRPDRLVLFSIGDEIQPETVLRTDARHPDVHAFVGRHLRVSGRTPTEVALARLVDGAVAYELERYGRRHLYCHTSFTHIGPLARPDLDVPPASVLAPDMGDLVCLNVYTYARGVVTSPPGSVTRTPYQGYLEELAAATDRPVLVTQVGLSTSPVAPKPWVPGFGGHRVDDVPATLAAVWSDIRTARGSERFCGLVFFELHDEWWKSGEDAADSGAHAPDDPEEWFGLYEVSEGGRLVPKGRIAETVRALFSRR